ncbi:MAG TPA: hypothetical protein VMI92_11155 [Steroidobacteraceae bacterium]|nr:hypothetical protein [Steroidobacteraceae bacterium]
MRNSSKVAFAVASAIAGTLAAGQASATDYNIYITGASAQRAFWTGKYLQKLCGGGAGVSQFDTSGNRISDGVAITTFAAKTNNNGPVSGNADLKAFRCTGTGASDATIALNDTLTMHYSAEMGSVWGIMPGLFAAGHGGSQTREFLEPGTGTGCSSAASNASTGSTLYGFSRNCPGTAEGSYYNGEDLVYPDTSGFFARHTPDIIVTDIEPTKWAFADNWPTNTPAGLTWHTGVHTSIFGPTPSQSDLQDVKDSGGAVIGQVFAVVLSTQGNSFTMPGNLSMTSAKTIFQGQARYWDDLPELHGVSGAHTQINLCRRDHGSGTQTSASITFTGKECGLIFNHAFASTADKGRLLSVQENTTGGALGTCVASTPNSIGIMNVAASSNWTVPTIDGIQPNAHNAASGAWPYAYETWGARIAGDGDQGIADAMMVDILSRDSLQDALGGEVGSFDSAGHFVVTGTANIKGYYALQSGNDVSVANIQDSGILPVQGFDRAGESCNVPTFDF